MHSADLVLFGAGQYLCYRGAERQTDRLPLKIQKEKEMYGFFCRSSLANWKQNLVMA